MNRERTDHGYSRLRNRSHHGGCAFTSHFAIPHDVRMQHLVNMLEIERRSMDIRPGMRHKYTPLRFDPATGARQVGGRYLFDTWKDAVDYNTFTSEELSSNPA